MSDLAWRDENFTAAPRQRDAALGHALLRRLMRRKWAVVGLAGLGGMLVLAVFASLLAPHDPLTQRLDNSLAPPFWMPGGSLANPLGTDSLGRDLASRIVFGARNSLLISVAAVLIGSVLGLVVGMVAGYHGGWLDTVLMRLGDVQLAFPFILLAIIILGVVPERTHIHLILVLGIPMWVIYARVVRSHVLAEREKDYVAAARALGASHPRTLLRYILPSTWQVVPVMAMLYVGFMVIMESTLSFLGFGLSPPTPSWGSILADGLQSMVVAPWLPIFPGIAIFLTVLSVNLAADGLADVFDPKLRRGTFRRRALTSPPPPREARGDDAALLRVRDLVVEFPVGDEVVRAVRGVSFDLSRGLTLGIVGESGSGKSVTAMSIAQLLDPPGHVAGGEIVFDGTDVTRAGDATVASLRGTRMGMIFQNPASSLNPVLSIGFQVVETIRTHRPCSRAEARDIGHEALASVGIGNPDQVLGLYPFQLSGGMNQRVMIAMTMVTAPDLLIADEPTTALDVTTEAQILGQLDEAKARENAALILITHDIALVAEYADVVLVMYAGQVCEMGPVESVVTDPKHPYTRALLDSIPRVDLPPDSALEAIPGELANPTAVPPGCPFATRCHHAMDVCWEVNPARADIAPGHGAACHLWLPDEAKAG